MNWLRRKVIYETGAGTVFHVNRWARVYINALGENAGAGLEYLRALVPPIKTIPSALFGKTCAKRLEKILRESAGTAGIFADEIPVQGASSGLSRSTVEQVIKFVSLIIEKNHFADIDSIISKTEEFWERRNGVLAVTAETAEQMDNIMEDDLKRRIMQVTGAEKVLMKTQIVPELMGGYRLQFGGLYIDASLKGQVQKMKTELEEAVMDVCITAPAVSGTGEG